MGRPDATLEALRRFWPMSRAELRRLEDSPLLAALRDAAASPAGMPAELSAACASMEAAIRDLFTALLLPIPRPAGPLVERGYQAYTGMRDCQAAADLPARLGELRGALAELAAVAIAAYRTDIADLERRIEAAHRAGWASCMDPFVAAVAAVVPDSRLVRGFDETRRSFERLVAEAVRLHDEAQPSGGTIGRLAAIAKATALARYHGQLLRAPEPRTAIGDFAPLHVPGNLLDDLNRAYYAVRGARIYEDFVTAASEGPLLAIADAATFLARPSTRNAEPALVVLEIGVGDGSFAAGFLDTLDDAAGGGEPVPRRVRYLIADLSATMLAGALASPALARHRDRVEMVSLARLATGSPPALQRYHELVDDLPECAILYVDRDGELWSTEVRGTFPIGEPARERDGSAIELQDLVDRIRGADADRLGALRDGELGRIGWQARLARVRPQDVPRAELLPAALGRARDALVPFNLGAIRFVEEAIARAPSGGIIRIFDYGFAEPPGEEQSYPSAAQVARPFGGSWTRNVNFRLLREVAARGGATTRLVAQEEFLGEAGLRAVGFRERAGVAGGALYSPVCSGADAPLPPSALEAHDAVLALAARMEKAGRGYLELAEALERGGWVTLGLPPWPAPHVDGLLGRLALDLDFSVNAGYRAAAMTALRDGRTWLARPEELDDLARNLRAVGFGPPPPRDALWLLAIEKR